MTIALEELAQDIGLALKNRGLKIATAESCTGGGLSYWITNVPGSSDWFDRGFVTYSNEAKIDMLGVSPTTIEMEGAVSEATAREMANGALQHSRADVSISITGIAGPTGGSITKPVGTVWIAWAFRNSSIHTQVNVFPGDRQTIRLLTIETALTTLLTMLNQD